MRNEQMGTVFIMKIHIKIILFKLDVGGDRWKNILPVTRHK